MFSTVCDRGLSCFFCTSSLDLVVGPPNVDEVYQRMDPTLNKSLSVDNRAIFVFLRVCSDLTHSAFSGAGGDAFATVSNYCSKGILSTETS